MKPPGEEEKHKAKPFKVSFIDKNLPGRSYVRVDKPINIPQIVASKFYSAENECREEIVRKYLDKLNMQNPREKYSDPITVNQRYGWFQIRLTDADPKDTRLNFHKRTNIIVKEHLMNYAKIRE